MSSGGTRCSALGDKPEVWEILKDQYEGRTATLQAKEEELKMRISQMESLLASRVSESCCCPQTSNVPKVFPRKIDNPVRDLTKFCDGSAPSCVRRSSCEGGPPCDRKSQLGVQSTSKNPMPVPSSCQSPSRSQPPKQQAICPTFFQKVMENAKSILTLKGSGVHPALDERPTRENDVTAYSSSLKQKKSNCSCEYDEEITRVDCTESTYSHDASNSSCSKACHPGDSVNTIKSKKTVSAVVNTQSCCNTSTSTDAKVVEVAEDGSQYVSSECCTDTGQMANLESSGVCSALKSLRKCQANNPSKRPCSGNKTCASFLSIRKRQSTPNVTFKECGDDKQLKSKSQIKEVDIQCAFIGSPMLTTADYAAPTVSEANQHRGKSCDHCAHKCPQQKQDITTVADLVSKEKEIKDQMQNLQSREKNYDALFNNYQNAISNSSCCCGKPKGQMDMIDKIGQELRLENKILKDELMQMKLEMKHCLEKIEGPIKSQLETEKMRCVHLENELSLTSKNMLVNQDAHMREMNALKLQLCMACSNINELNSINRRLKGEMASLDGKCLKLEDDLMKQKISEAETIKLLTKRRGETYEGLCTCSKMGVQEKVSCDSNLHIIARKLSKTLRDSEPCEECAKLPAELASAAKCIKDLSDLVESHKVKRTEPEEAPRKASREMAVKTVSSQAPPETMEEGSQCMEGQRGDEARTAEAIPLEPGKEQVGSEIELAFTAIEPAVSDLMDKPPAESTHPSAAGEPLAICSDSCNKPCPTTCATDETCLKQGKPCLDRPSEISFVREKPSAGPLPGEPEKVEGESVTIIEEIHGEGEIREKPSVSPTKPLEHPKTWEPPPCTESCGSDQPCAMGKPCYIIRGRGDQPEEKEKDGVSMTSKEKVDNIIEPIIEEVIGETKYPSDAIIEPPEQVPSEIQKLPSVEKALESAEPAEERIVTTTGPEVDLTSETERVTIPSVPRTPPVSEVSSIGKEIVIPPDITEEVSTKEPSVVKEPSVLQQPNVTPRISDTREPSVTVKPSGTSKEPSVTPQISATREPIVTVKPSGASKAPSVTPQISETREPSVTVKPSGTSKERGVTPQISETREPSVTVKPSGASKEPSVTLQISETREPSVTVKPSGTSKEPSVTTPRLSATKEPSATAKPSVTSKEPSATMILSETAKQSIPEEVRVSPGFAGMGEPSATEKSSIPSKKSSAAREESATVEPSVTPKTSVKDKARIEEKSRVSPKLSIEKEPSSTTSSVSVTAAEQISPTEPITEEPSEMVQSTELLVKEYAADTPTYAAVPRMLSLEERRDVTTALSTTVPVTRRIPSFLPDRAYTEERTGDFPFEVETTVEILDVPPPDLNVTTTITASGTLEVITVSPEGLIETTLNYKPDGSMEVVTRITEEGRVKEAKASTVKIAPSPAAIYESPRRGSSHVQPRMEQDSFFSGATDLTGLETVTESTKETTFMSSSFLSDYDKTVAVDESAVDTTVGKTFDKKEVAAVTSSKIVRRAPQQDVPSRTGEETVSMMECCEEDALSRQGDETASAMECCEDAVSRTGADGTSTIVCCEDATTPATEADVWTKEGAVSEVSSRVTGADVSMKECCEEDAISKAEDGVSVVECCVEEAESHVGEDGVSTVSYAECCQEGTEAGKPEENAGIPEEMVEENQIGGASEEEMGEEVVEELVKRVIAPGVLGTEGLTVGTPETEIDLTLSAKTAEEEGVAGTRKKEIGEERSAVISERGATSAEIVGKEWVGETFKEEIGEEKSKEILEEIVKKEWVGETSKGEIGEERSKVISEKGDTSGEIVEKEWAGDTSKGEIGEERSKVISEKGVTSAEIVVEEWVGETPKGEIGEERSEVISEKVFTAKEELGEGRIDESPEALEEEIKITTSELPMAKESLKGAIETGKVSGKPSTAGKTAQQALTDQKRDCGCQATPQAEQSCQCCECKDVGVSTSRDSETLTDENMVRPSGAEPLEQIPEVSEIEQLSTVPAETSQISRDFAEAVDVESGPIQVGTSDEVSTIHEGSTQGEEYKNKRGKSVRDRDTGCVCSDESEEESEYVPTAETAVQCECDGPIERDDHSEGRLSSGSDTDPDGPSKKTSDKGDLPAKKISSGIRSRGDELDGGSMGKKESRKEVKSVQSKDKEKRGSNIRPRESERGESRPENLNKSFEKKKSVEQVLSSKPPSGQIKQEKIISVISSEDGVGGEKLMSDSNIQPGEPLPPGKVPSVVRKRSSDTADPKKPRKSRSSSQRLQNIECDCPGVCQCVICSPKIIAQRKALTGSPAPATGDNGRPCWCTTPSTGHILPQVHVTPEVPNVLRQPYVPPPPIQDTEHATGCRCLNCQCKPCTPCPPEYAQEAFVRSTILNPSQVFEEKNKKRTSVNDVFEPPQDLTECPTRAECQKSGRSAHPLNCECVDCLCLPDIRRIAELKEHPVIKDDKQVYQVKCYCENTKKPVSVSKIPIPTNSTTGPPKARTIVSCTCGECVCTPCNDPTKGTNKTSSAEKPAEGGAAQAAPADANPARALKMTPSELAKLCDCQDCQCTVCFDKPKKPEAAPVADKPAGDMEKPTEKAGNKNCCCKGECICGACAVDQLVKQVADAGKPSPETTAPASVPEIRITPILVHPEDCDCDDCFCPHSVARRGSQVSLDQPEDCDCTDCFCPHAKSRMTKVDSKTKAKASASKLPVKVSTAAVSTKTSRINPDGCTCGECVCPGKDAVLQATGDRSQTESECRCLKCTCPGKEILQSTSPTDPSAPLPLPSVPTGPVIAECDCVDCQCTPCADPKRRKPGSAPITPCDCSNCVCEPCADISKRGDTGDAQEHTGVIVGPSEGVPLTASSGVGPTENRATHPPDCICDECLCQPEEHEAGCTCPECKCVDCYFKRADIAVHAEGCQCVECKCVECNNVGKGGQPVSGLPTTQSRMGEKEDKGGCTCDMCRCVDCFHKPRSLVKECTCADCICVDCPDKGKATKPVGAAVEKSSRSAVQPAPITHACHCIKCTCDICTVTPSPKDSAPKKCTCELCQCADCGNLRLELETAGKDCTCVTCQCDDCQGKKKAESIPTTASNIPQLVDCICEKCKCVGDPLAMPPIVDCKCKKCTCSQQLQVPPGAGAVPESRAVTPVMSRAVGEETSPFTDPPPFEVPVRKRCTCGRCDCLECSNGAGGVSSAPQTTEQQRATAVQSLGVVPPATAEAPPFEVPVRKPCTCGRCDCSDCNKLADTSSPSAAGVPPAARSATTSQVIQPSTSYAATSTARIQVPRICTCQRCDCTECNKQGAPLPPAVSVAASTKTNQTTGEQVIQTTLPSAASHASRSERGAPLPASVSFAASTKTNQTTGEQVIQTTLPSSASHASRSERGAPLPASVSFAASTNTNQTTGEQVIQSTTSNAATSTARIEVPRICTCQRCDCTECNKEGAPLPTAVSFAASTKTSQIAPEQVIVTTLPISTSVTQQSAVSVTQPSSASAVQPSSLSTSQRTTVKCGCSTCACNKAATKAVGSSAPTIVEGTVSSKSTGLLNKETVGSHVTGCNCTKCCIREGKAEPPEQRTGEIIDLSKMDNEALMKKIETDKEENCKCKVQINELRQALDKIKCSCTEAEMKAIKSTMSGKPFVKQASAFGQTMSGLKFALSNLQDKCKAKDRLIEAMTGELKMRTSSNTLDRVLNTNVNVDAPDYDKADDVKSLDRPPDNTTNVLFPVTEEREIGHTRVRQKSSENNGHKHKKKSKVCKCGKQHKDRDSSNVDLSGFEVVDIRRITQDSIIIKWKPPQSNLINGYDIFVNGVNKSKVMSGSRTSAMVHSLDLSSTIQITIYAVTKCGRCEPPAIAIYEINA